MPSKAKSPQLKTFAEFRAFDIEAPNETEIKIAEELVDLRDQLATIQPALRVLTNRVNAASREHQDAKALAVLNRVDQKEVGRLEKACASVESEKAEVNAEAEALRDMIMDAEQRLAAETKRKTDEFKDSMKQARLEVGQNAINALFDAYRQMGELRAFNSLIKFHGTNYRLDRDIYDEFFVSVHEINRYFRRMREAGYEAPEWDDLNEIAKLA